MYTIDDLRGQFSIEGAIKVMEYNYCDGEYKVLYEQENGNAYNIPDEICNIRITYMYQQDNYLVIEIE